MWGQIVEGRLAQEAKWWRKIPAREDGWARWWALSFGTGQTCQTRGRVNSEIPRQEAKLAFLLSSLQNIKIYFLPGHNGKKLNLVIIQYWRMLFVVSLSKPTALNTGLCALYYVKTLGGITRSPQSEDVGSLILFWTFLCWLFFNELLQSGHWEKWALGPLWLPPSCWYAPLGLSIALRSSVFSIYLQIEQAEVTWVWSWSALLSPWGGGIQRINRIKIHDLQYSPELKMFLSAHLRVNSGKPHRENVDLLLNLEGPVMPSSLSSHNWTFWGKLTKW